MSGGPCQHVFLQLSCRALLLSTGGEFSNLFTGQPLTPPEPFLTFLLSYELMVRTKWGHFCSFFIFKSNNSKQA